MFDLKVTMDRDGGRCELRTTDGAMYGARIVCTDAEGTTPVVFLQRVVPDRAKPYEVLGAAHDTGEAFIVGFRSSAEPCLHTRPVKTVGYQLIVGCPARTGPTVQGVLFDSRKAAEEGAVDVSIYGGVCTSMMCLTTVNGVTAYTVEPLVLGGDL